MNKELERRIATLEAENKELRSLWIETEGDVIELRIYLDRRLAHIEETKQDVKAKALAKLIMHIHRKSGGVIKGDTK